MKRFKIEFNTLNRSETLEQDYDQLRGSDLQKYADHLLALSKEGVVSAVFQLPAYGKVKIEII